jgi:GLPGLI family protein
MMIKSKIYRYAILSIFLLFATQRIATAQAQFITAGKIEFEKKVNLQKENEGDSWFAGIADKVPKFRTSMHNLYFKEGKTIYEKGTDVYVKMPWGLGDDATVDDIIYTDLKQGTFSKKMIVFDDVFLLSDSIRHIKWQMTNDLRDIAGFECHKAVGKILDSVYVVAFYTDQITVPGGPLSFTNLPGMILGIAIPRTNLTIFATKVELIDPKPEKFTVPKARKTTNYKTLQETVQKAVADWGSWGRKNMINIFI